MSKDDFLVNLVLVIFIIIFSPADKLFILADREKIIFILDKSDSGDTVSMLVHFLYNGLFKEVYLFNRLIKAGGK